MSTMMLSDDWSGWAFNAEGKFTGWADRRGLFNIRHPWEESHNGDCARLSRQVELPESWEGSVIVSFFATDNHHGRDFDASKWPHYVGADIFIGHRFAQLLVDGEVVWEQDVAETDSPSFADHDKPVYADFYHSVNISDRVKPGQRFELSLRFYDKVGSAEALPGDIHQARGWHGGPDPTLTVNWFDMTGWWGDVALTSDAAAQGLRITFKDRINLSRVNAAPGVEPAPLTRVELQIARADTLPKIPYPIWGGVPFPRGLVREAEQIRLLDEQGTQTPVQVQVCSRWPQDGSVQWAWLNVLAAPGQRCFVMECGRAVKASVVQTPLSVREESGEICINTGVASLAIPRSGGHVISSLSLAGGPLCGPITGVLNQQMLGWVRRHVARVQEASVEERGPVRASVRIAGRLDDGEGHVFGRFTARIWAWANSPFISLSYRIFQDADERVVMVDELLLEAATPFVGGTRGGFTAQTFNRPVPGGQTPELELRDPYDSGSGTITPEVTDYLITSCGSDKLEKGMHSPGWANVRGQAPDGRAGGLALGVRWLWQQGPKSLTISPGGILVGLFARRQKPDWRLATPMYFMTRGEAKRHQVWLMPHDGTASAELIGAVQQAWDARPHLMNGEWFGRSGAMGFVGLHGKDGFPEMDQFIRTWDNKELPVFAHGIREFRDTFWCNNYRGRAADALIEYLASERADWQDYFEQAMAHNLDVDTIHYDPEHPEWVGAIRSYSPYHTTGHASGGINSNCQDQFLHYFFSGEPDSLDEAIAAAGHIVSLGGNQGRSARQEGWPMAQMSIAYQWTGDATYLRSAEDFLKYADLYTHPRRGAYDETHGTFSHRGLVPFMTGYLGFGLIRLHEATGDERAARLLIALAEATVSETGDGKGGFWYSPNPDMHNPGSAAWSSLIGGMLAYSYRLTSDPWFAKQARLCYEKIVSTTDLTLDMAPLMGEHLAGLELAIARGDISK